MKLCSRICIDGFDQTLRPVRCPSEHIPQCRSKSTEVQTLLCSLEPSGRLNLNLLVKGLYVELSEPTCTLWVHPLIKQRPNRCAGGKPCDETDGLCPPHYALAAS